MEPLQEDQSAWTLSILFTLCWPLTTPISPAIPSTRRTSFLYQFSAFSVSEESLWNADTHSEHVRAQADSLII